MLRCETAFTAIAALSLTAAGSCCSCASGCCSLLTCAYWLQQCSSLHLPLPSRSYIHRDRGSKGSKAVYMQHQPCVDSTRDIQTCYMHCCCCYTTQPAPNHCSLPAVVIISAAAQHAHTNNSSVSGASQTQKHMLDFTRCPHLRAPGCMLLDALGILCPCLWDTCCYPVAPCCSCHGETHPCHWLMANKDCCLALLLVWLV